MHIVVRETRRESSLSLRFLLGALFLAGNAPGPRGASGTSGAPRRARAPVSVHDHSAGQRAKKGAAKNPMEA